MQILLLSWVALAFTTPLPPLSLLASSFPGLPANPIRLLPRHPQAASWDDVPSPGAASLVFPSFSSGPRSVWMRWDSLVPRCSCWYFPQFADYNPTGYFSWTGKENSSPLLSCYGFSSTCKAEMMRKNQAWQLAIVFISCRSPGPNRHLGV